MAYFNLYIGYLIEYLKKKTMIVRVSVSKYLLLNAVNPLRCTAGQLSYI